LAINLDTEEVVPLSIDLGISVDAISGISNPGDVVSIFDTVTTRREDKALFLANETADSVDPISDDTDAAPNVKV
jgi:hypothetical protein